MSDQEDKTTEAVLKDIDKRVKRVESALLGDNEFGIIGFLERFENVEHMSKRNESKIQKIYFSATLVGSISAIVFSLVKAIFL